MGPALPRAGGPHGRVVLATRLARRQPRPAAVGTAPGGADAEPVDTCAGAATSIRLDEAGPTPELLPVDGAVPACGCIDPGAAVEPDAVTGASTLTRVPVAWGLELRPMTTAAGVLA